MEHRQTGWQRYIKLIVVLASLALFAIGAWQYTEIQKRKRIEEASLHYEAMLQAVRGRDLKTAKEEALSLVQQYSKTIYAPLGALMLARFAIEQNDVPKAISELQFAIRAGSKGPIGTIAKVRLARILMSEMKYEEALKLLEEDAIPEGYTTLVEETKGDIYVKQKEFKKAKEAYLLALKAAPQGVPTTMLQLKSSDLSDIELNDKEGS